MVDYLSLPEHAQGWLLPRGEGGALVEASGLTFRRISVECETNESSVTVVLEDPADGAEFKILFVHIREFVLRDDGIRMRSWVQDGALNCADVFGSFYEMEVGPYSLEITAGGVRVEWYPPMTSG
jgi:hypothetical protein